MRKSNAHIKYTLECNITTRKTVYGKNGGTKGHAQHGDWIAAECLRWPLNSHLGYQRVWKQYERRI